MMEVDIKLDVDDWRGFQKHLVNKVSKEIKTPRSFWKNLVLWFFIAFTMMFLFRFVDNSSSSGINFDWKTALIVVVFFLFLVCYFIYFYQKAKKKFEPSAEAAFACQQKYIFNNTGFLNEAEGFKSEFKWPFIMNIERASGMILLFIDTQQAFVFPENKLDNPDEFYSYIVEKYEAAITG